MATKKEFIEYLGEQTAAAGVTFKKMFGEYGAYCNGKLFSLVCDDRFFVKITPSSEKLLPDAESAPPYSGAKPMLVVENIDDSEFMCALALAVSADLPEPKPKKKREKAL